MIAFTKKIYSENVKMQSREENAPCLPSARPYIMKNAARKPPFFPFRGCLFSEYGVFYLFVMNFST